MYGPWWGTFEHFSSVCRNVERRMSGWSLRSKWSAIKNKILKLFNLYPTMFIYLSSQIVSFIGLINLLCSQQEMKRQFDRFFSNLIEIEKFSKTKALSSLNHTVTWILLPWIEHGCLTIFYNLHTYYTQAVRYYRIYFLFIHRNSIKIQP